MKYTKEQARRTVLNCAKQYEQKLLNKNLLIIYRDRQINRIRHIEVAFYEKNFQHLTGLELVDEAGNVLRNQSENFYRKCIENKLSVNDFRFRPDGTAQLKLMALPVLTNITRITKITGDYNGSRPYLLVDRVIGNVNFCLGLNRDGESGFYVPSSALLEDIKKLSVAPCQVLVILEKEAGETAYSTVRHVAKGLELSHMIFPAEIKNFLISENTDFTEKE